MSPNHPSLLLTAFITSSYCKHSSNFKIFLLNQQQQQQHQVTDISVTKSRDDVSAWLFLIICGFFPLSSSFVPTEMMDDEVLPDVVVVFTVINSLGQGCE